ncbi:FAD:protein FMN transferase [Sedimenticola hydrogenitrophicus]|uniref:FAD:protein FMN transferase n=1 Tax=Sedimenticola hydrogenitrophicus TaxID=2967975 RepID=UPI002FF54298
MKRNSELIFFSEWFASPLRVASVTPSSAPLARAMASAFPVGDGTVVELGGGTGPITHDSVSVKVLDDDPVRADAWSTALLCLGHAAGLRAADQAGIAALFIADEDGRL